MPESPQIIPWEALTALSGLALVLVTAWISLRSQAQSQTDTILAQMEAMRSASDEGRARLYSRIDGVVHELRQEFVSKDVHNAFVQRVDAIDERLNRTCEVVRLKRAPPTATRL